MLGAIINEDRDKVIFVSDEEWIALAAHPVSGEIFDFNDVRDVYCLELMLDESRGEEKSNHRIASEEWTGHMFVYVSEKYYQEVSEKGRTGTREGQSKIDIVKESFAQKDADWGREYKRINSKYEHRDDILAHMKDNENKE